MSPKILRDVRFFAFLGLLDLDLAASAREARCSICDGPLHSTRFPRKLHGVPAELAHRFGRRESFCCGERDCRKRVTPPSVVFFGRLGYCAAMVLLVSALADGASDRRLVRLTRVFGIDRRTLLRWQDFWRDAFPKTDFFRAEGGRMSPALRRGGFIRDLLRRFAGGLRDRLISALLFLSPLSTGSVAMEQARRWVWETRRGRVVIGS